MKKEAILHVPLSQYAYAENEHSLIIRLRAAKGDLKQSSLFYGDRVDQQESVRTKQVEMKKVASDDLFDYFEGRIEDGYTRVCYYFLLNDGQQRLYYYERNFCEHITCGRTEYFQFPYIRREDIIAVPEWAKDMVMYHIFPDSFATAKQRIAGKSVEKKVQMQDGTEAKSSSKLGGTLAGIRENLDYLCGLGINCIYLNPVFAANSYHKYDTMDYFSIDPCFGTIEDLKLLVKECHAHGIRMILDGVFNHCGPDFFAFRDVLAKGKKSKYYDWFYHMPEPICYADPPSYEAFAYVKEMPKLNTSNPEVEKYLIEVGTYWIRETDIDGWRLDVANEINHDFWRRFRSAVRKVKEDVFLIGEIWEDAGVWLGGDQFDSTMNYRFSYLCRDFFAERRLSVTEFDAQIQKMIYRYPDRVSLVQMNFLDSHDVPRFLSYCAGDRRRMELAFFYLFMGYGIPSVFYGDECYLSGRTEAEYRRAMPWADNKVCAEQFHRHIAFRKSHSAVRNGRYRTIYCGDEAKIYVFARENDKECILFVINNADHPFRPTADFWTMLEEKAGGTLRQKADIIPEISGAAYVVQKCL